VKKLKFQADHKKQLKLKDLFAVRTPANDDNTAGDESMGMDLEQATLSNLHTRYCNHVQVDWRRWLTSRWGRGLFFRQLADMEDMVLPDNSDQEPPIRRQQSLRGSDTAMEIDDGGEVSTLRGTGAATATRSSGFFSPRKKRTREDFEAFHQPDYTSLGPCPDEATDRVGCLMWRKKKWAMQREARKRRKTEFGQVCRRRIAW